MLESIDGSYLAITYKHNARGTGLIHKRIGSFIAKIQQETLE